MYKAPTTPIDHSDADAAAILREAAEAVASNSHIGLPPPPQHSTAAAVFCRVRRKKV